MTPRILSFLKKKDSINIIINTFGNYLNVFFIAVFALILVRIMDPVEYGVLSVLLGIMYVLANILDFGITANIYSILPVMVDKSREKTLSFLKSNLVYQTSLSIIVILLLIIFFPALDKAFFKTYESRLILNITAISTIFMVWQNSLLNILFATKKFIKANLYLNLSNLIKTAVLLVLIYFKAINVGSVIFIFAILGPLTFIVLLFFHSKNTAISVFESKIDKQYFKLKYTLPYFVGTQFFNLGLRMDLFLLSYFSLGAAVGFYGLAQKIVLTILTTIISITQVISPNFSKIVTRRDAISNFKNGFVYLIIPIILFVVLFFTPDFIFQFIFTKQYGLTAQITKSLVIPYIFFAIGQLPFLFILYVAKKISYILVSNILFFLGMTLGCYYLIPKLGVFAPAYVITISIILGIIIQTFGTIYEYKKLPK